MNNIFSTARDDTKGTILLVIISIYWGITAVLMKNALDYMNSVTYLFLRFLSASVFLTLIFRRKLKYLNIVTVKRGLIVGLLLTANMELLVLGLNFTSNSNSVFISNLSVVIVPIILCIRDRRLPEGRLVGCILLIMVGLFFLSGGIDSHINIGDAITLGSTIVTSFGILKLEEYCKSEEPLMLGITQIFSACIFSGIVWGFSGFDKPVINMGSASIIFLTGVIGTGIAFIIQVFGQKMTSPVNTALAFISISIFGVIGSAFIPNARGMTEPMTTGKIVGSIVIVMGMAIYVISTYYSEKSEKSKYTAKTYKAS